MKRIVVLALLVACGAAWASEWVDVSTTTTRGRVFIDMSSVIVAADARQAWVKYVYPPHTVNDDQGTTRKRIAYEIFHVAFECSMYRAKLDAGKEVYEDGTSYSLSPDAASKLTFAAVGPGTNVDVAMKSVCALPAGTSK